MFRLGCLFILVPILELALLFRVGGWIGVGPTLLLVAGTGLLGAFLVRREGVRTLLAVQAELARGVLPTRPLVDGAAVLVGGALLMTPGVATDALGLALLLPPTRVLLYRWAQLWLTRQVARGAVKVRMWGSGGGAARGGGERGGRGGPAGARLGGGGADGPDVAKRGSEDAQTGSPMDPPPGPGTEPPRRARPGEIIQE